ncbi:VOC family protein [Nocardioides sp. 503]|uniref:VOC family protein n=1 Tax=Nocardioides sp. 503 TaxID=2508326 RepID=UPI0010701970|nr:VOC family protein [Nocardioides sp. 503]
MPLHRLTSITIGVPDVEETAAYYEDFGLLRTPGGGFATADGGEQMRLTHSPQRRLLEVGVGVDDRDDLDRVVRQLGALDLEVDDQGDRVVTREPIAGIVATVSIAEHLAQASEPTPYNYPGNQERSDGRAPGLDREGPVRPRKLGHLVIGSTDADATQKFFTDGLGFKISDEVRGLAAFMRCTTDHHNVLVQKAPINYLHHTSWQVDDVDEIGRGAMAMLEKDPGRHVWGLGRHYVGSNFFWYLKDPAGNFSEYYSDLDCIVDDELWEPGVYEGARGLYAWGPPPPPSFLAPEDLGALMTGTHASR